MATPSLELKDIIGAPLKAIIEGETIAAQSTVDFIKKIGFENSGKTNKFGTLRMISFYYKKQNLDGSFQQVNIKVPLLSILPIPVIQILNSEIEFALNITESTKTETDTTLKFRFQDIAKTTNVQMKVKINVGQADMPAGLSKIFNIMEQSSLETNKNSYKIKKS